MVIYFEDGVTSNRLDKSLGWSVTPPPFGCLSYKVGFGVVVSLLQKYTIDIKPLH